MLSAYLRSSKKKRKSKTKKERKGETRRRAGLGGKRGEKLKKNCVYFIYIKEREGTKQLEEDGSFSPSLFFFFSFGRKKKVSGTSRGEAMTPLHFFHRRLKSYRVERGERTAKMKGFTCNFGFTFVCSCYNFSLFLPVNYFFPIC